MENSSPSSNKSKTWQRREFLKAGALAAAGALLPGACASVPGFTKAEPAARGTAAGTAGKRPNLILFVTDDQAWDLIGYENPLLKTPNLDRLARRGIIFKAGHSAAIPCVASRSCFMSGLNHHRWEHASNNPLSDGLKEGSWTWTHALRSGGYRTGLFGKMHFFPTRAEHGFDVRQHCDHGTLRHMESGDPRWKDDYHDWLKAQGLEERKKADGSPAESNGLMDGWKWPHSIDKHPISFVRDRTVEFLQAEKEGEKPYAAIVSFRFPHSPYIPAEPFASMYDPASIEMPGDTWEGMEGYIPQLDFDPKKGFNGLAARPALKYYQQLQSQYWGLMTQIDDAIGTILNEVDLNNTLILFFSDHGDYRGKRGRILKMPAVPFDAISRVPYFAAGYGVPQGAVVENPVSLIDVGPTFLRAAGLDIPADLDGHPLQDYFQDPKFGNDRSICCTAGGFHMVQVGKIIYFLSEDKQGEMLFDLSSDPNEKKNLAADPKHGQTKARMQAELDKILNKPRPNLPRFDAQSNRIG